MNEDDRRYDRLTEPHLHGRGLILDRLMSNFKGGCTLFAFDGVGGAGKSELAQRFGTTVAEKFDAHVVAVDLGEWPHDALIAAGLYERLREIPRSTPDQIEEAAADFKAKALGAVGAIAAAAMQDLMKYACDKAENTAEAIKKALTGEAGEKEVKDLLVTEARENRYLFIRTYMELIANLGERVVIILDNYEDAEPSGQKFVRFIIDRKPEHWAVIVLHNSEKPSESDWFSALVPAIAYHGGELLLVECLNRQALSDWFEAELGRPPEGDEIDRLVEVTGGGRPALVKDALIAMRDGAAIRPAPDLEPMHAAHRASLSPDARTLAELIAFVPADRMIPLWLIERVAAHAGLNNIGPASDALHLSSDVRRRGRELGFSHSSRRECWISGLGERQYEEIKSAWTKAAIECGADAGCLATTGVLPLLAPGIVAGQTADRVTEAADGLLNGGSENQALSLLDASWQTGWEMNRTARDGIDHALMAAQARLELGRYREAHETLRMIEGRSDDKTQNVRADLLRLKLALRQNTYSVLWRVAKRLDHEAQANAEVRLERELVVNAALRDLGDREGIVQSIEAIVESMTEASAGPRGRANRSLARSLAKLGQTADAERAARDAIKEGEASSDLRSVGNAHLALGEALRHAGDTRGALEAYRQGEDLARGTGNRDSEIWCILGRACAMLDASDVSLAREEIDRVGRLVNEPGFEHPLETAHVGLLSALADALEAKSVDEKTVLAPYERLGIPWPSDFLRRSIDARAIVEAVPI